MGLVRTRARAQLTQPKDSNWMKPESAPFSRATATAISSPPLQFLSPSNKEPSPLQATTSSKSASAHQRRTSASSSTLQQTSYGLSAKRAPYSDPFASTTYANVSCERASCSVFSRMSGVTRDCAAATCTYEITYADKSFSKGFFAHDKLTIGSDSFQEFYFGCGQNNKGNFAGASGILGLGRDDFSVAVQTEEKYGNFFSYCLPSRPSYVGKLTFGKGGVSKSVKYTPLVTKSTHPSLYIVEVVAISVGGVKLGIPPKVLSASGTVIDSGTAI